jgi:hypothetical protein
VRRAALLIVVATLAAGCGGGHAHDVLSDTARNLGKIHSGDLTLRLVVLPREGTKGRIGFELHGPFALRPGALPLAKVAYTQIAGARQATATFISTGTKAYAEVNGKAYELPASATESIRRAAAGPRGSGGLGGLDIASWVEHPSVSRQGDDEHVSADLDVVDAANGLLGLLRGLGRAAPTIDGAEEERLRDAVDSSSFDVWTGMQYHLLRRLLMKADLGLDVPASLRRVLGDVVGAKIEFELAIAHPNEAVSVAPPPNPLPSSQLPSGGG